MSEQILEKLIKKVSKLPGLGPRSSRRAVLHLLKNKDYDVIVNVRSEKDKSKLLKYFEVKNNKTSRTWIRRARDCYVQVCNGIIHPAKLSFCHSTCV